MSRFLSDRLLSLEEYVPGEQPQDKKYIKLNTNESPFPPSPKACELLTREAAESLRLYSDPSCKKLTEAICKVYDIGEENVIFSNGSDEVLSFAFTAFCDKTTPAIFPDISYGFYEVFANLNCIDYKKIPLCDDFSINPEDYKNAGGTIFIANPNAPTGLILSEKQIRYILETNKNNVVVIDEAYIDFGGKSVYNLTREYDNLLVVQTYSKSRSLAGARLGFGIGCKELIADLQKIRNSNNPYNVNRLTQELGGASMLDTEYFKNCTGEIIKNREYLIDELIKRDFTVLPSLANFVFAKHKEIGGEEMYLKLKENGVLVRHFSKERISEYNRITIGDKDQVTALIECIDKIISEVN